MKKRNATLSEELDRIFHGSTAKGNVAGGHPVHYLVQTDNRELRNKTLKILISALFHQGRIKSRRYCEVIFAGYPEKMEGFLQKNPGLRSRIAFHVPFADYNTEEMYKITELLVDNKNMSLASGVREKLVPIFEAAMKNNDFGNGRFARNLVEKAIMKQASRLVAMDIDTVTGNDIKVLFPEDFDAPVMQTHKKAQIGFSIIDM